MCSLVVSCILDTALEDFTTTIPLLLFDLIIIYIGIINHYILLKRFTNINEFIKRSVVVSVCIDCI